MPEQRPGDAQKTPKKQQKKAIAVGDRLTVSKEKSRESGETAAPVSRMARYPEVSP